MFFSSSSLDKISNQRERGMRIPASRALRRVLNQRAQNFDSFANLIRLETRETEPQPGIEGPRNGKISSGQIIDAGLLGQSAQAPRRRDQPANRSTYSCRRPAPSRCSWRDTGGRIDRAPAVFPSRPRSRWPDAAPACRTRRSAAGRPAKDGPYADRRAASVRWRARSRGEAR